MMEQKYFMHRIRKTSGNWDKGIEIKDTLGDAKQSWCAYLGAYAYGHDQNTDYVQCNITDIYGNVVGHFSETWIRTETAQSAE